MQKTVGIALLFLIAGASAVQVSPTQKVVQMLEDMATKGKKEMQEEQVRFASFAQFCEGAEAQKVQRIEESKETIGELQGEIEGLELEIDQLAASIEKADADIAGLAKKIAFLDGAMKSIESDEEEVTEERNEEHALFEKKDKDLSESVDALDRAVAEMKTQDVKHAQASLIQVMKHEQYIPDSAKKEITAFLQQRVQTGAPAADAYEFQSGGVIDMFSDLEVKMEGEKSDAQKVEMNRKHAYMMLMQDLENRLQNTKDQRERDIVEKAQKEQQLADAQGEKANTEATLAEDEKYLAELRQMCKTKTAEYEQRQETRQGELDAIAKATEILAGGGVTLLSQKHAVTKAATSFAQVRAAGKQTNLQRKVVAYLEARAKSTNSRSLALLAAHAANDPFTKVKKMINDMITKLMEEANEEAEHKAWCDTEMGTNKHTRDEKTEEADKLSAEIDFLGAKITKLTEEVTELTNGISTIDKAVTEATSDREAEKAKNTETIADAKTAITACSQATAVLKEFYAKAGEAASFAQAGGPAEDAPEMGAASYAGNTSGATGVLGMLEVIQSDFAELESETSASESEADDFFKNFMAESTKNKAVKEADVKFKQTEKQEASSSLQETKKDLAATYKELEAATDYYGKLKPACVDEGESFEDKQAARKQEIDSLQEALEILSGDDIPR